MPIRTRQTPAPYDASVQRRPDPRHLFDRDPLLIPTLFVDTTPWYRRRLLLLSALTALVMAGGSGFAVHRYGVRGTFARAERAGAGIMYRYTRFVAGRPASSVHNR